MTNLPKNGQFFERRRMFVQAPFHNMKSYLPLDWTAQQASSQQLQRVKAKQTQEQESLRKIYNQQVDKRLERRYAGYVQPDLGKSRNQDVLTREVEIFNHSKMASGEVQKGKQETREMGLQYQSAQHFEKQAEAKNNRNNSSALDNLQNQSSFRPNKDNQPHYQYRNSNPQLNERDNYDHSRSKRYEHVYPFKSPEDNNSFVQDRYASLQMQRSPYPKQNLSKLVQQLYTGSKVQEYPFRNIVSDKLENHLREKTKADRKRAYEVSLNLFKH